MSSCGTAFSSNPDTVEAAADAAFSSFSWYSSISFSYRSLSALEISSYFFLPSSSSALQRSPRIFPTSLNSVLGSSSKIFRRNSLQKKKYAELAFFGRSIGSVTIGAAKLIFCFVVVSRVESSSSQATNDVSLAPDTAAHLSRIPLNLASLPVLLVLRQCCLNSRARLLILRLQAEHLQLRQQIGQWSSWYFSEPKSKRSIACRRQ
mmetsp:Transcript_4030/g.9312  ORF Transcript_4030/g.9312 Transcript_4030/m.9312 type:complete len:206 (-) Transcript_4030:7130-7747(-)